MSSIPLRFTRLVLLICGMLGALQSGASVIYRYSGNAFDTFSDPSSYSVSNSVTGFVEFEDSLASNLFREPVDPVFFSFSDGVQTIKKDSPDLQTRVFEFSTDADANIVEWGLTVRIGAKTGQLQAVGETNQLIATSNFVLNDSESGGDTGVMDECLEVFVDRAEPVCDFLRDSASVELNPGSWTAESVPLPGTLALVAFGLFAFRFRAIRSNGIAQASIA